jgi:poly(3-hydroxybutyrate) depolymerase
MTSSLSSNQKISKMKFCTRIEFCKIQEMGHLIAKKDGGLKLNFDLNFQFATYVTSIRFLSIQQSLTKIHAIEI